MGLIFDNVSVYLIRLGTVWLHVWISLDWMNKSSMHRNSQFKDLLQQSDPFKRPHSSPTQCQVDAALPGRRANQILLPATLINRNSQGAVEFAQ